MTTFRVCVGWCVPLIAALTGCGGAPAGQTFVMTDSAGVVIATNAAALATLPEWRFAPEPELLIGVLDGDPALQFSFVTAGTRLRDGRLAVLDAGSHQVRFFQADGSHQRSVGRRGDGPGEFQRAGVMLRLPGDSLAIWDEGLRRVTFLDPEGELVRSVVVPDGLNPQLLGVTTDGVFLLADMILKVPDSGFEDIEFAIRRFDPVTSEGREVTLHPGMPIGHLGTSGMVGSPLFAPRPVFAPHAQGYWAALGREYEVAAYDSESTLMRLVRWSGPTRATTAADREAHRTRELAAASEARRERVEELIAAQPLSPTFPAYQEVMSDHRGALRVQQFPRPTAAERNQWLIFDVDGQLTARVTLPGRLRVLEWGDDYLLGILPDGDGVERVAGYRLERSGGG